MAGPPSRGPADAPVVLEVYSDFHCPFSKRFAGTLDQLREQFPAQVRVVFRHFPLPIHPEAPLAHEASLCAQEKGKFWEFHDRLMASTENPGKDGLAQLAGELGLDVNAFQRCVDARKYRGWVEREIQLGKASGATGTPSFLIHGRLASGAMPVETLKPLVDWYLNPAGRYPGPTQVPAQAPEAGARQVRPGGLDPSQQYSFPGDWLAKGPSKGPAGAPVTVVEFFDYHCPFCQKGAQITDQILEKYQDKVRVVSKQLPLPMHPNAAKASEALLCAHEQGKFWELRKEFFGPSWGKREVQDMKAAARNAGLDAKRFDACLDGSKMKETVEGDVAVIRQIGQTGTPTFFINGSPVVGARPIENFQQVIDEKLAVS
jgi:protein-disulfide isomerase